VLRNDQAKIKHQNEGISEILVADTNLNQVLRLAMLNMILRRRRRRRGRRRRGGRRGRRRTMTTTLSRSQNRLRQVMD